MQRMQLWWMLCPTTAPAFNIQTDLPATLDTVPSTLPLNHKLLGHRPEPTSQATMALLLLQRLLTATTTAAIAAAAAPHTPPSPQPLPSSSWLVAQMLRHWLQHHLLKACRQAVAHHDRIRYSCIITVDTAATSAIHKGG